MRDRRRFLPVLSGGLPLYLFRDTFTTDAAAGAVDGTACEPGPGVRAVTDSAGTAMSITGGVAAISATTGANDPRISTPAITRVSGRAIKFNIDRVLARCNFGLYTSSVMNTVVHSVGIVSATVTTLSFGGSTNIVPPVTGYHWYSFVLRATGCYLFVQGQADYPSVTMLWAGKVNNAASVVPAFGARLNATSLAEIEVRNALWLPSPLASDGMSAATTDGAGHAETSGLGSGGSGLAYTNVGTWGVAAGVRSCSALDGGVGISTVDCGKADVLHYVGLTRSAGNVGIVVRKADATNYIYAYTDGTNATVRKVVNGTDSEVLAATAITYAAGADMTLVISGSVVRLYYNMTLVGTADLTIADATLQSGTGVGVYTTDTGNTFDNLVTYARGTGGEYENFF